MPPMTFPAAVAMLLYCIYVTLTILASIDILLFRGKVIKMCKKYVQSEGK